VEGDRSGDKEIDRALLSCYGLEVVEYRKARFGQRLAIGGVEGRRGGTQDLAE